jgi:hypothetical protein
MGKINIIDLKTFITIKYYTKEKLNGQLVKELDKLITIAA